MHTFDVHRWVASFLEQLAESDAARRPRTGPTAGGGAARRALDLRLAETDSLLLLLDYDGTLVPFTPTPELARPDAEAARRSCAALAARPDTQVHVVSGRPATRCRSGSATSRSGCTPSTASSRAPPRHASGCRPRSSAGAGASRCWPCCARSPQRTPGSLVEVKAAALAWHYRMADQETGARRANELRLHLNQVLSNQPVEILAGNRVIEIRPYGMHKGRIVPALSPERLAATTIVAIGDDRTDEDLFNALPPEAISIRVGPGATRARFRLDGVAPGASCRAERGCIEAARPGDRLRASGARRRMTRRRAGQIPLRTATTRH